MTMNGKRRREASPIVAYARAKAPFATEQLSPVTFKGAGGYIVSGPESRQVYCFSSHDPEQMVDARDTDALLKTGLFRLGD